ncbi:MAG TPA: hypothetical protein VJN18_34425 [Polyangiaceae bacterium]|nr:hypothetical protein [Polyangiaceae bacterium]
MATRAADDGFTEPSSPESSSHAACSAGANCVKFALRARATSNARVGSGSSTLSWTDSSAADQLANREVSSVRQFPVLGRHAWIDVSSSALSRINNLLVRPCNSPSASWAF